MMIRFKLALAMLMPLTLSLSAQTPSSCTRHFYNRSNFQWSIKGFNGDSSSIIVAPNSTVEIQWGASTSVTISGEIPNRPYVRTFTVQPFEDCVSIQHQGNTGNATLNKPTAGDVTTCAGGC